MSAPERQPETRPTWEEVREALRVAVNAREETTFARWFDPVTGSVEDNERGAFTLRLVAPTSFHRNWLRDNYLHVIEMVWRHFAPEGEVVLAAKPKAETKAKALQPQRKTAEVIQLPLWPEPVRGMPNPILRAALFAAIQGKSRRFINGETLAAVQGITIRYKGEQLNQEDLEVCAAAYHLARMHPLGDTVHTTAHGFLKLLGRKTGKSQHVQLHESLFRLMQPLEIETTRYQYNGALVMEGVKDKETRHYVIKINPKLAPLFSEGWTGLQWEQRQQLRGKPLALWLQGFYASHAEPLSYKVETLRALSGGQTTRLDHFRRNLRRALSDIENTGAIQGYKIDESDLVHIHKVKTLASRRKKLPNPEK